MKEPIFIVGVPRSGTTLVRMVLDSHPNIYSGSEMPWLGGNYGGTEASLRGLSDRMKYDVMSPVKCMSYVDDNFMKNNLRDFILNLIKCELKGLNKTRWVEKTPDNIVQLPFLHDIFPNAKFVHIIRDGRDVALSTVKTRWPHLSYFRPSKVLHGEEGKVEDLSLIDKIPLLSFFKRKGTIWVKKNIPYGSTVNDSNANVSRLTYLPIRNTYFHALWRWREWLRKYDHDVKELGVDSITLHYEEIVSKPQETFERLLDFIGEPWVADILSYKDKNHQMGLKNDTGSLTCLKQLAINPKNFGKWENELTFLQKHFTAKYFDKFMIDKGYRKTL